MGRNDVVREMVEKKLGSEFLVTKRAMTKRKGISFNLYSKSRQDLCLQYKENAFTSRYRVVAGIITSSSVVEGSFDLIEDGEVLTGIVEFKNNQFEDGQTLAEMLCVLCDCSTEQLRGEKQIKMAVDGGDFLDFHLDVADQLICH